MSEWAAAGEESLGSKPKQWLVDGDGAWWLWKESTDNVDRQGRPYRKGDDWSEVAAWRIGIALGIPVATVHLASRESAFGVISRRIEIGVDKRLVHGNELLAEVGVNDDDEHDRDGYTLDAVEHVLDPVDPPTRSSTCSIQSTRRLAIRS